MTIWVLGGELRQETIALAPVPEGDALLRRVAFTDQERWRDSRHTRMRGLGALGDTDDQRGYPYLPLPEWLMDCCTVCAEIRRPARELPDSAITDPRDFMQLHRAAELQALTFRATQIPDLLRLVVEPSIQTLVEEIDVKVSRIGGRLASEPKSSLSRLMCHAAILDRGWRGARRGRAASVQRGARGAVLGASE